MTIIHRIHEQFLGFMPRRTLLLPTLCIVLLVVVWTLRLPDPSLDGANHGTNSPVGQVHMPPVVPFRPPAVLGDVDLSDIEAPFIGWPLQRLCDEATYVEGLVYICDNNSGGVGNIRNYIHTCIRYAIEAGATGLVVPRIRKRSEQDLADLFTEFLPLSYMFNVNHFKDVFNTYCPQITLYDNVTAIPNAPGVANGAPEAEEILPKDFGNRKGCDWKDQNRHTDRFGQTFRGWLMNPEHGVPPSKERPRLFRLKWGVLWDWQTYRDGPELWATFGSMLRFNDELLYLGKMVLKKMHEFAQSKGAEHGEFLGLHLRTESDAMGFWPTYATQSKGFLEKAQQHNFKAAYLATGNATEAMRFENDAAEMVKMKVVTKTDLLSGKDLERLNALSWDQQGLVDSVVLLSSKYFVGTFPSSFSVYTTLKRHLRTGGLHSRPYKAGTEGDGLSFLVGRYDQFWEDWLFMFEGMWP